MARLQIYDCLASEWMTGFNLLKAASGAYNAGLYRPKTSDRKIPQVWAIRIGSETGIIVANHLLLACNLPPCQQD